MRALSCPRTSCCRRSTARARVDHRHVYSVTSAQATATTHTLKAVPLSPDAFRPFGQVVEPTADGKEFDEQDAQLDLRAGTPRLYIMRLPRRGLGFCNITFHANVTQCLGTLTPQPWYLAVARPSGSVDAYPRAEDITAFRIQPGVFVKLHKGTWHAGPLFEGAEAMDFANLELADTNVVDHNTHHYAARGEAFIVSD